MWLRGSETLFLPEMVYCSLTVRAETQKPNVKELDSHGALQTTSVHPNEVRMRFLVTKLHILAFVINMLHAHSSSCAQRHGESFVGLLPQASQSFLGNLTDVRNALLREIAVHGMYLFIVSHPYDQSLVI